MVGVGAGGLAVLGAFGVLLLRRRRAKRGGGSGGGGGGDERKGGRGHQSHRRPLLQTASTAPHFAQQQQQQQQQQYSATASFTAEQIAAFTSNLSHLLGKGAFGAVFAGNLPDGRRVAVKQMALEATTLGGGELATTGSMDATGDRAVAGGVAGGEKYEGEAGFRLELETLGRCRHANIVALLGYCIERRRVGASTFSLVLEYMPGGSLLERLRPAASRWPPLAAAQRCAVASDVARGLEYLHVHAVPPLVHQDVKSDNVLLATDVRGRLVAKVADFGTARVVPAEKMKSHHSTKVVVGTTPYMPGEYLQLGRVSEKTDTYAFGVVLLELLTGKPPFDAETSELLVFAMKPMLQQPAQLLPPLLDEHAGGWAPGAAQAMAQVARWCTEAAAHERGTVREVRGEIDRLAGRAEQQWRTA